MRSTTCFTLLRLALPLVLALTAARGAPHVSAGAPVAPRQQPSPTLDPGTSEPSPTPTGDPGGTSEPSPEPSASVRPSVEPSPTAVAATPTDAPTAAPTAAPRPIYFPWVDKASAATKQEPIDRVAGDFSRVAIGPRQVYAVEGGPPRLSLLLRNEATQTLDREGSLALEASVDPRTVRLTADPSADYAYLLYQSALTVVEGLRPPEPRKLVAAPDCEALAQAPFSLLLGCDGLRLIDLDPRDAARDIAYVARAGRAQALAAEDGLLAAVFREAVPASRPSSLELYQLGYRRRPNRLGALNDVGFTVDLQMSGRTLYQLVDQDGRRGLQIFDVAGNDAARTPRLLASIAMEGLPRRLALDRTRSRLYLLEEGWFDRRDRLQHGMTGVRVYRINDPRQPRLQRFLPLDQPALDIAAGKGLLYVAGGTAGLEVYRVE